MAFANATERWIARHFADRLELVRDLQISTSGKRCVRRRILPAVFERPSLLRRVPLEKIAHRHAHPTVRSRRITFTASMASTDDNHIVRLDDGRVHWRLNNASNGIRS